VYIDPHLAGPPGPGVAPYRCTLELLRRNVEACLQGVRR
jgi:hypothetical protein